MINLVDLLCYIAISLGETSYVDHYIRDFPCVTPDVATAHVSPSPRSPPCLLRWLEKCLQFGCKSEHVNDLPDMVCKDKCSVVSWARKIVAFFSLLLGAERNERKLSSGVYCDIANGSASTPEELTVLAMVAERFGLQHLDLLPAGVSLPLRHVSLSFPMRRSQEMLSLHQQYNTSLCRVLWFHGHLPL